MYDLYHGKGTFRIKIYFSIPFSYRENSVFTKKKKNNDSIQFPLRIYHNVIRYDSKLENAKNGKIIHFS